jgi:hypothetical protein
MDQTRREALRMSLLGLAPLRFQSTPVLAPKGTVKTSITGTTALGITETGIGQGTNPRPVSLRKSLYATAVISQATMPPVAQIVRSLRRLRFNPLSRNTTRHRQPVLSLPD